MAVSCEACATLREIAPEIEILGITESNCNSLKKNTGLVPANNHKNCIDIQYLLDCYLGTLEQKLDSFESCDYKPFVRKMLDNLYNLIQAIHCSDCGQWERIEALEVDLSEVWRQITLIWEAIEGIRRILAQSFQTLIYGTDYTVELFNGIEFPNQGHPNVQIIESAFNIVLRVIGNASTTANGFMRLTKTNDFELRHATPAIEVPKSWLFNITFMGNYEYLNTLNPISTVSVNAGTSIWNLNPSSARARWAVFCSVTRNAVVGSNTYRYLYTATQIADGYNGQLNTGKDQPLDDVSAGLNFNLETTFALRGI